MAMLHGQYIILLSLSVSVLTALKKYKGCHLERKNSKYTNKLGNYCAGSSTEERLESENTAISQINNMQMLQEKEHCLGGHP